MSASPAPNAGSDQEKRVAFRFCSECSNILYPKEDTQNATLMFECRTCRWSCQADTACIYRNELTNTIGATAGVTQDVAQDPTVGTSFSLAHATNFSNHGNGYNDQAMVDAAGIGDMEAEDGYDAHGHEYIPDMCTLCGDEIYCDVCGEQSYGGAHVFVDELGRISNARVHASRDGNVGAFVFEQPAPSPTLPEPQQQTQSEQLQIPPLEQLQLQMQKHTPSPPPTPPHIP